MSSKRLSLALVIGLTLLPGLAQLQAAGIERVDLRVEGMT
jgi:hypothetical protein